MCIDATTRDLTGAGLTIPAACIHRALMAAWEMRYARVLAPEEFRNSFPPN
jgi:hypothetical protein